jgi:hypothetical protein
MGVATRDWSGVKESLRRERHVHDLLAKSGSARLHQRVMTSESDQDDWRTAERIIVDIERSIRLLDTSSAGFWTEYRDHQDRLIKRFHDAKVTFYG